MFYNAGIQFRHFFAKNCGYQSRMIKYKKKKKK